MSGFKILEAHIEVKTKDKINLMEESVPEVSKDKDGDELKLF